MELIEKIVQILQIWSLGKSPTSKIFLFTSTKVQSAEKMNSKKNILLDMRHFPSFESDDTLGPPTLGVESGGRRGLAPPAGPEGA